jgi:hypothetical protein
MSQLASTYFKLGKVRDAHMMSERVLEFQQRVLPKWHPHIGSYCVVGIVELCNIHCVSRVCHVLRSGKAMLNVAAMNLRLGMHQDAMVIQKAVLGLRQRQLSDNHPDTCEWRGF